MTKPFIAEINYNQYFILWCCVTAECDKMLELRLSKDGRHVALYCNDYGPIAHCIHCGARWGEPNTSTEHWSFGIRVMHNQKLVKLKKRDE